MASKVRLILLAAMLSTASADWYGYGDYTYHNNNDFYNNNNDVGYSYKNNNYYSNNNGNYLDSSDCRFTDCQNEGTCDGGFGYYYCSCLDGFMGNICENVITTTTTTTTTTKTTTTKKPIKSTQKSRDIFAVIGSIFQFFKNREKNHQLLTVL